MKGKVPDQEVGQRTRGERLCKITVRHLNWTWRMSWIVIDGESR